MSSALFTSLFRTRVSAEVEVLDTSDGSLINTVLPLIGCCLCFTGLCVQQNVGTGESQGCSIVWCSVT